MKKIIACALIFGLIACKPGLEIRRYVVTFEHTNDNGHGTINPHAIRRFEVYALNADHAKKMVMATWGAEARKVKVKNA